MIAKVSGPGHRISTYEISDQQMSAGSTLGGPKATMWIKPTGAIEKFWSIDAGALMFETLVLHHWDERTGIPLTPLPGQYVIHPDHQEHLFELSNGLTIHEDMFVLSSAPRGDGHREVDPPAAYCLVEISERRRRRTFKLRPMPRCNCGAVSAAPSASNTAIAITRSWFERANRIGSSATRRVR